MKYNTRQKEAILKYLQTNKEHYFTVEDIWTSFMNNKESVSKTTIYRYLEELKNQSIVKKIMLDNQKTGYEYLDCDDACYHLVCCKCNKIIHINCESLTQTIKHILTEHDFVVTKKSIFQGICLECRER